MDVIIARTLTVTQNGAPREVTLEEALQHKTYQQAIAGSRTAQRQILKMIEKREAARRELRGQRPEKTESIYGEDNKIARVLDLLGIAHIDPKTNLPFLERPADLLLEPWVVEAALARRKYRHAPWEEWRSLLEDVHRSTRDAESVSWPLKDI